MPTDATCSVYYKKHWTYYPIAWLLIALQRLGVRFSLDSWLVRAFTGTIRVKFGESGRWERLDAR